MLSYTKLSEIAGACEFSEFAPLDVKTLEFLQDVRDMCNPQQCPRFDNSWACPPHCGSLEDMRKRASAFEGGILVQTVGELEDSYDWDGIQAASKLHSARFSKMWDMLENEGAVVFAMGTGGCSRCETCAYLDGKKPCRYPERMAASMEACGLYVSKVCTDNNLKYNYGSNKIAYTACFLVK